MALKIGFADEKVGDNDKIYFGSDEDYSLSYGSGSDNFQLTDETNALNILLGKKGGNIEFPNGDIDLTSGNARINTSGSSSDSVGFYDTFNAQDILVLSEGGGVNIPNGSLGMGDNNIENVNNIVKNDANASLTFVDETTGNILSLEDTGDVDIPNGDLTLSSGDLTLSSGGARINTSGGGADSIGFFDTANTQNILVANEGGDVEISNGQLDVADGTAIVVSFYADEASIPTDLEEGSIVYASAEGSLYVEDGT